jgi:hypothetical protein
MMKDVRVISSLILLIAMLALSECPENVQQGSSGQPSESRGGGGGD